MGRLSGRPPSITNSAPVTKLASPDARNVIISATSWGLTGRPRGCEANHSSRVESLAVSKNWSTILVSTMPGCTELQRIG